MEKIAEGIYAFSNIVANQYLLVEDDGITLIDTGLKSNYHRITRGIHSLGLDLPDLKQILITHADLDHFGALRELEQNSPAAAWTSQPEADAIGVGQSSRELKPTTELQKIILRAFEPATMRGPAAKIDRIVSAGEILPIFGGLRVLDSKGHTPGHLSFYLPRQNILFSGDSIFLKRGKLISSYGINCWDEACAIESLNHQLDLSPRLICGGHGIIDMGSI